MSVSYAQAAADVSGINLDGRSVCIVDDDNLYRLHLSALLGQAHLRTMEAGDSDSLATVLDKEMPDCILLDYNLESENGFRLHEQLRLRYKNLSPVIMLSGDESQRTAIKAFRMGLYDFLPKRNLRIDEITIAIKKSIARHEVEASRDDEVSELRKKALFDDLTGMYSRAELDKKLSLVSATALHQGSKFVVFSISLAEYRKISTNFGVANADEILRGFAAKIRTNIRSDDFCGRYDEDTFHYVMDWNVSTPVVNERLARLSEQLTFSYHLKSMELRISPLIAAAISSQYANLEQMEEYLATELCRQRQARGDDYGEQEWSVPPATAGSGDPRERRRSDRMRTLKPAFIALEEWSSKINCTVRSISDGGARVRVERQMALPEHFLLKITASGPLRRVRKCWHVSDEIGVEFCDVQQ